MLFSSIKLLSDGLDSITTIPTTASRTEHAAETPVDVSRQRHAWGQKLHRQQSGRNPSTTGLSSSCLCTWKIL